jgi:hypothetical protein
MWERFKAWARQNARVISVVAAILSGVTSAVTCAGVLYHFFDTPIKVAPVAELQTSPPEPLKLKTPEILPSERFDPLKNPGTTVDVVPLPRPRPDMWEQNYLVWVAQPSSETGDGEGPTFKREWRSCLVPNAHFICKKDKAFRMDKANWPYDVRALANR